ncbi:hypothetical protein [Trueperella pecoris]|uniref:Polysaccharide biosynthesis protein n=1 Tax=Trueperella pecoris TaxID=2733571 RepID=A0A7M1QWH2_9ACTO|nr:hypothetical protein [Trueperella pecoris]QOQ39153.1 hypothetical protein HLG82_06645 [Trueperella pecoris]QOR46216.1 hypothetical protein INS88_03130 [Trueperella pecoris]QTG76041.1 hypothetical protein J4179_03045 [Trueperella pecoris]
MTHPGTHKSGFAVSVGAVLAAVSGFAILLIAAHVLSASNNAVFLSFWSALFLVTGVLSGIQQEVTRATTLADERGYSPFRITLLAGFGMAIVVMFAGPFLGPSISGDDAYFFPVLLIAVAAFLYAGQMTVTGSLAGVGLWRAFGVVTGGEALVRLFAVSVAAFIGQRTVGFQFASVVAFFFWLLLLATPSRHVLDRIRVSFPRRVFAQNIVWAMAAAGATAFLVNGFPFVMAITTPAAEYQASADLAIAVSVTRAPILVPVFAFQAVVVAHYVRHPDQRETTTRRLIGSLGVLAAVLVPVAALVGPFMMGVVFGPAYRSTPLILGVLVADAVLLALLVLGGTITIAMNKYRDCLIGWYLTVALALAMMTFLPLSLVERTLWTLSLAPIGGIVTHLRAILR